MLEAINVESDRQQDRLVAPGGPGVSRSGGAAVHSEGVNLAKRGTQEKNQSGAFREPEGHGACRSRHAKQIGSGGCRGR